MILLQGIRTICFFKQECFLLQFITWQEPPSVVKTEDRYFFLLDDYESAVKVEVSKEFYDIFISEFAQKKEIIPTNAPDPSSTDTEFSRVDSVIAAWERWQAATEKSQQINREIEDSYQKGLYDLVLLSKFREQQEAKYRVSITWHDVLLVMSALIRHHDNDVGFT